MGEPHMDPGTSGVQPQKWQAAPPPKGKEKPQVGGMGSHQVSKSIENTGHADTLDQMMKDCQELMADIGIKDEPKAKFKAKPIIGEERVTSDKELAEVRGYKPLPKTLRDYGGLPTEVVAAPVEEEVEVADESTATEEEGKVPGYEGLPVSDAYGDVSLQEEEPLSTTHEGYGRKPPYESMPVDEKGRPIKRGSEEGEVVSEPKEPLAKKPSDRKTIYRRMPTPKKQRYGEIISLSESLAGTAEELGNKPLPSKPGYGKAIDAPSSWEKGKIPPQIRSEARKAVKISQVLFLGQQRVEDQEA